MIIKKFKIFESTEDSVRDLEDIFLDIDLEFECDVYVFYINPTPSDRIGYYSICLEPIRYTSNGILEDSKIDVNEFLNKVREKIEFSRKIGFSTYKRGRLGYGTLVLKDELGGFTKSIEVNDNSFINSKLDRSERLISLIINLIK
jgi:hypothetical protein